jgi:hypothetical protein
MNQMQSKESDTLSGTRRIWLLLLLLVLIVVLVTYDQGSARVYGEKAYGYGEKAYTSATTLTEKATRWAKQLYECGLPGCKAEKTTEPVTTASVTPNPSAAAGHENPLATTPSATPGMPATGTEQKSEWAVATASPAAPAQDTSAPGGLAQSGSQNQPTYPAYPAYPPYSSFGSGSSGGGSSAPAGETPAPAAAPSAAASSAPATAPAASATPPADTAQQPYLKPATPPAAAVNPLANPSQPPQGLLPAPRVVRPDQLQSQTQKPVAGSESNDGLALARKSAQAGRLGESVHYYLQHLTVHPQDVNAYGELGNVYLKTGRYPEAAQNYYEAATRLIDAGQMNAVTSLMPIIQMHEPMLANLLNQKIARATEGSRGQAR